jgi:hypothetical protein
VATGLLDHALELRGIGTAQCSVAFAQRGQKVGRQVADVLLDVAEEKLQACLH